MVDGATGALPSGHSVMLDRSAVAKRGLATSSSAMAGTRNVADGRSRSTVSNQRSTSKRGRYSSRMPIFIGLWVEAMPAKVHIGEEWSQPDPVHGGRPFELYGRTLRLAFVQRLRDERKFPDIGALQEQIAADVRRAARLFDRLSV